MKTRGHLCLEQIRLAASTEWLATSPGWRYLRVSQGDAYWLGPELTRELAAGQVIVGTPLAQGRLRASQLSEVEFHTFYFRPELVTGFFTLWQRSFLEAKAVRVHPSVRFFPASHRVAEDFAKLVGTAADGPTLLGRCLMLELAVSVLAEGMLPPWPKAGRVAPVHARFHTLVTEMTDSELACFTAKELAAMCGCSRRYFIRLFQRHFRLPVRVSRQTGRLVLPAGAASTLLPGPRGWRQGLPEAALLSPNPPATLPAARPAPPASPAEQPDSGPGDRPAEGRSSRKCHLPAIPMPCASVIVSSAVNMKETNT
jgi:AraC-like DNA-binding protein